MDIERTMEFIVDQLAKTTAGIEELRERMNQFQANLERMQEQAARTDARLDKAVALGIRELRNERRRRQELDARFDEKITQLASAQLITEEKLQRLEEKLDKFIDSQMRGGDGNR
jgi:chromosome segregation ATPase